MPEYLISYCPELSAWRLTDCETWQQRVITTIAFYPGELAAIFSAARDNPEKTQGVTFKRAAD